MSPYFRFPRIDLRRLILSLTIATALLTLANTFYASYKVQKDLLIRQTLEANRVYAQKLAESTENFLASARQQLAYSAGLIARHMNDRKLLLEETDRLRLQTSSFNSTLVVDVTGLVLATSPQTLELVGTQLRSPGALHALSQRRPLISAPYVSAAGNLLVSISHPIIDSAGRYLGYVGGTIYLQQRSILFSLLGEHYYKDGSYLYVADSNGRLLYHPEAQRVGEIVHGNPVIEALSRGERGSRQLVNSHGIDMLAGFAPVPSAGWGIVAQRPLAGVLNELQPLMLGVLRDAIPLSLVTLLGIWWLARLISHPLRQLARKASHMDEQDAGQDIRKVQAWYYEATQLKAALLAGLSVLQQKIGKLSLDSLTDPLSGLLNRRGLHITLEQWQARQLPFAVIAIDIDHFKRINDQHGHDQGDQSIRHLAALMRQNSRIEDVLCRSGGEEFIMLLPAVSLDAARLVAERLRLQVQDSAAPGGVNFTLSAGVACWQGRGEQVESVLKSADQALYSAKSQGRNRVETANAA